MMLSPLLLQELRIILREEYGYEMSDIALQEFAQSLIGYFSLMLKGTENV